MMDIDPFDEFVKEVEEELTDATPIPNKRAIAQAVYDPPAAAQGRKAYLIPGLGSLSAIPLEIRAKIYLELTDLKIHVSFMGVPLLHTHPEIQKIREVSPQFAHEIDTFFLKPSAIPATVYDYCTLIFEQPIAYTSFMSALPQKHHNRIRWIQLVLFRDRKEGCMSRYNLHDKLFRLLVQHFWRRPLMNLPPRVRNVVLDIACDNHEKQRYTFGIKWFGQRVTMYELVGCTDKFYIKLLVSVIMTMRQNGGCAFETFPMTGPGGLLFFLERTRFIMPDGTVV